MSRLPLATADSTRRTGRPWLGPLVFGCSVWCAAGIVTAISPASSEVRAAVPASAWWLAAGAAVGAAIPGFRHRASLATPALLSALPWLPVPLPSAALIWSGALAWVPIGLALFAGLLVSFFDKPATAKAPEWERDTQAVATPPRFAPFLAGTITLAVALVTAWALAPHLPGGDEPHYLVITQSLLLDGDLRIENNHLRRDYAAYVDGALAPDFVRRGKDGEIYSIHAPGVSALVLPLFALFGYGGAQLTVMLTAAVASGLVWFAGWLATSNRSAAWFAWAAVAGSTTFVLQGVMVFPDGPALLPTAAAVVVALLLRRRNMHVGSWVMLALSVLLTALPWLHTRLGVLAAGLAGLVIVEVMRGNRGNRFRRLGAFLLIPALGALLWLAFFLAVYGTPNPTAPYGNDAGTRLAYIPGGIAALLFDAEFGLLTYAPALALAVVGWTWRRHHAGGDALGGAAVVLGLYLAAVGTFWMWWAGVPATPARLATAALPLLVPAIAVGWTISRPLARAIWSLLLGVTLTLGALVVGVDRGRLAWNARDAWAEWLHWLGSIANLPRGWPSFFWTLTPGEVTSEAQFALHVFVWIALFAAGSLAAVAVSRRQPTWPAALIAAWWLPMTGSAALQAGWLITEAATLEPASAQVRVLESSGGRRVWQVASFNLTRLDGSPTLLIRVPRRDLTGPDAVRWSPLADVPAGRYRISVRPRRPVRGRLTVKLGEGGVLLPAEVRGLHQSFTVDLPAGGRSLVMEPDAALAEGEPEVELTLQQRGRRAPDPARSSLALPGVTIFFLDESVFSEGNGFWIRGADRARMVLHGASRAPVRIAVTNGAQANHVTVDLNGDRRDMPLAPSAGGQFDLVLDDDGLAVVTITSSAGFRPSDAGGSDDRRYLGVWVTVE
jgi:hypothetical protein